MQAYTHIMGFKKIGVVFLLPGDRVEHCQRQVAGKGFRNREAAGLCHQQIGGVHVFFHLVGEIDQPGGKPCAGGKFLFKGLVKLPVASSDHDNLHFDISFRQIPVKLDDVGDTEAACHEEQRGQFRVEVQVPQDHGTVLPVEKHVMYRDAEGINFFLGHAEGHQLRHHVVTGHHIGVHIVRNPGPVYAVVGENTDQGSSDGPILLEV